EQLLVVHIAVGGGDDRVDEVGTGVHDTVDNDRGAGLHRSAGDEHGGDVQAQGRVEHARGDLVAVRDADQRVGGVRIGHVLDGVGDDLAARQRVQHAAVAHGDTVVDRDGVKFARHAAG